MLFFKVVQIREGMLSIQVIMPKGDPPSTVFPIRIGQLAGDPRKGGPCPHVGSVLVRENNAYRLATPEETEMAEKIG